MKASILILTKNGKKCIQQCLDKVCSQKYDLGYEVIVIDSGSTDGTLEVIKKYPVRFYQILPHEFRHNKTRNLGASLAHGEFLVYLSQDAQPLEENWLSCLTAPLLQDPAVGAVFGKHVPTIETSPVNQFRIRWLYGDIPITKKKSAGCGFSREFFSFSDVNAAMRKELMIRFPFREDIFFCEDVYFSKQLMEHGYKVVYAPTAAVFHSHDHGVAEIFCRYFDIAIAYKKIGILNETKNVEREGVRYAIAEFAYLLRCGNGFWIPYSLAHNIAKYLGFKAGCSEWLLPLSLKKEISKHWYSDERIADRSV